jgi:hypothetical protein
MIALDSSHYLATLNSIKVAKPMVAQSVIAKELRTVLLNSFLQCRPIDVVEAVLKVNLDGGRHLCIITIGKGLKMITGKDCGVVGNLYTSWDGTAKLPKLCKQLGKKMLHLSHWNSASDPSSCQANNYRPSHWATLCILLLLVAWVK